MNRRSASSLGSEKTVAALIFAGLATVFVSLAFGHLIGIALTAIGLSADSTAVFMYSYGTLAGVLIFSSGLGLGLLRAKGIWPKGPSGVIEGAYVVSLSTLNAKQEPIWNEGVYDTRTVTHYVQVRTPFGTTLELTAENDQIVSIGEGQTGRLVHCGGRLVSFVPEPSGDRTPWID